MNATTHRFPGILVRSALAAVLAVGSVAAAPSSNVSYDDSYGSYDETYGDEYQSGDFARLTYAEDGVTLIRGHLDDGQRASADASVNAPVFAGDTLRTDPRQRVELELAGGSLVRLDRATEVRVQALPDPYAEFEDNTVLGLVEGAIQVVATDRDENKFRIDTPSATVYLLGAGEFRVETDRGGRTHVLSYQGVAEVAGDGGSVLVRAGQRTEAWSGSYPADPVPFNTLDEDAFARFNRERDRSWQVADTAYAGGGYADEAYDAMPYEVRPYYRELSAHGRWVYIDDYGWSWYPAEVAVGWRPYRAGYWDYGPRGYFWVSHEPWGWAPYHYGRWSYHSPYGWIWTPGRVFAGAWVSWSWGSAYVGWCALDFWNRPVGYGYSHWGYYGHHSWTFIHYDNIVVRDYTRYAVPIDRIGRDLDGRAVTTRPPRVAPRDLREDVTARREAMRQARASRPALDRGLERSADRARTTERTRFRDIEDRLVRRGARAERIGEIRGGRGGDRGVVDRGERAGRAPGVGRRGDDVITSPGRRTGTSRPGSPAVGRLPSGDDDGPRVRPRQIRSDRDDRGDDRVRDLYRRIQRPSADAATDGRDRSGAGRAPARSPDRERARSPQGSGRAPERRAAPPPRVPSRSGSDAVRPARPQRREVERSTPPTRGGSSTARPAPTRRERQATPPSRPAPSRPSSPPRAAPRKRDDGGSRSVRPAPSRTVRPQQRSSPRKRDDGASRSVRTSPSRSPAARRSSGGSRTPQARPAPSRPAPSRSSTARRSSGGSRAPEARPAPSRPAPSRSSTSKRSSGSRREKDR